MRAGAAAVQDASMAVSQTRYAIAPDGVYLAYQAVGEGPVDLVWQFDLVFGTVEDLWETVVGDWLRELSSFTRLILHDRRGTVSRAGTYRRQTSKRVPPIWP